MSKKTDSHFERISFRQFAFVPHARAFQRFDRARFVDVNDGVELFRQTGVKIVTESFRFRPINHADRALEPRTVNCADHFFATIAQVDPKSIQSGLVK